MLYLSWKLGLYALSVSGVRAGSGQLHYQSESLRWINDQLQFPGFERFLNNLGNSRQCYITGILRIYYKPEYKLQSRRLKIVKVDFLYIPVSWKRMA